MESTSLSLNFFFLQHFDNDDVEDSMKVKYLKDAIKYQSKYKLDAMCGKAVDRHLFGLYVAGKLLNKVPELFTLKVDSYILLL